MEMSKRNNIQAIIVAILMALFLYSAIAKISDFDTFSGELSKSPFLYALARPVSFIVPGAEALIAVLLLIRNTRLYALYVYLYMMASFTCYVYLMMAKAYYLPCACMGIFDSVLGWEEHLVLNAVLTGLTFIAILLEGTSSKRSEEKILTEKKKIVRAGQNRPVDLINHHGDGTITL
jgi:hypothetical protein